MLTSVSVIFAQTDDLWDWIDDLADEIPFGYIGADDKIEVKEITEEKVVIESPLIVWELGEEISNYTVMYSTNSLTEILEDSQLLDDSLERDFDITSSDPKFTIELDKIESNIDADKIYYAMIVPKDDNDIAGELSNEICFQLSTLTYGEGEECKDGEAETMQMHGAAGPDMTLAYITHTVVDNRITLRWTALEDGDEIELYLWDDIEERYNKLTTVSMDAESYSYTVNGNGPQTVRFIPIDNDGTPNGKEKIYTFNVNTLHVEPPQPTTPTTTPTTPTTPTTKQPTGVTQVPVVGPGQNIAIILLVTFIGYVIYRRIYARH